MKGLVAVIFLITLLMWINTHDFKEYMGTGPTIFTPDEYNDNTRPEPVYVSYTGKPQGSRA